MAEQHHTPDAAPSQTFLFADLVGFTALTEVHGDEVAADVALRFAQAVEAVAAEHGAEVVKLIGDCVMLRTARAADAIRLGMRLVGELPQRHGLPPVRAGAHTGPAVARGTDWFGATVNLAARVSGAARGGELLVTEATAGAAGDDPALRLVDLGPQTFRNVAAPVVVLAAAVARRFSRPVRPPTALAA